MADPHWPAATRPPGNFLPAQLTPPIPYLQPPIFRFTNHRFPFSRRVQLAWSNRCARRGITACSRRRSPDRRYHFQPLAQRGKGKLTHAEYWFDLEGRTFRNATRVPPGIWSTLRKLEPASAFRAFETRSEPSRRLGKAAAVDLVALAAAAGLALLSGMIALAF